MKLLKLLSTIGRFAVKNKAAISVGVGVGALIAATVTAAEQSVQVSNDLKQLPPIEVPENEGKIKTQIRIKWRIVRKVWKRYIVTVLLTIFGVVMIFYGFGQEAGQLALATTAYELKEAEFDRFRQKTNDIYGNNASEVIANEIAKDKMSENPIIVNPHEVYLCSDKVTGQKFYTSSDDILRAQNLMNYEMLMDASRSAFVDDAGITVDQYCEYMGIKYHNEDSRMWTLNDGLIDISVRYGSDEKGAPIMIAVPNREPHDDIYC